jgi:hypothetical protein
VLHLIESMTHGKQWIWKGPQGLRSPDVLSSSAVRGLGRLGTQCGDEEDECVSVCVCVCVCVCV